jgi:hypothetical protein
LIIFKDSPGGGGDTAPDADTIILDDFSSNRLNGAIWGTAGTAPLWYPNLGYETPTASGGVLTAELGSPDGGASKHQLYCRLHDDSTGWRFIRTAVESGTFVNNSTNRLRMHVKTPLGYEHDPDTGFAPIHIGTFLHNADDDDGAASAGSEDDGMHYYHYCNIPGDGLWWQVIFDPFPDHKREGLGATEHGDLTYPETVNHTYFSQLTAFYWDYLNGMTPGDITQFKNFTFFSESVDSGTMRQTRTMSGAFDPASNTVKLAWNRRKDQPNHEYTIRWAHAPFASFTGGTLVGSFNAPNTANSNTVYTEFVNGALAGHQWVWVAIQPTGSASFRQFAIDLELND